MRPTIQQRREAFKALHESGCFLLPNPWDVGSALYLQQLGFKALATTSSGHAWSVGRADNTLPRAAVLAHLRVLVEATDVPINADFEAGFAPDPEGVAESVRLAVDTGVAGLSIEDSTHDPQAPLRELADAVARMRAARVAIDAAGGGVVLVGRAENFIVGRPDLDDTIRRLEAYAEAGADCLYAPGLQTREQISAIVSAVAPKPVNVLVGRPDGFTQQDLASMGVRRISVGGALARVAWGGFQRAARQLAEAGRFDGFAGAASNPEMNALWKTS